MELQIIKLKLLNIWFNVRFSIIDPHYMPAIIIWYGVQLAWNYLCKQEL